MSDYFPGIVVGFAFTLFILSGIADVRLKATWNKKYFTTGLPIFHLIIPVETRHSNTPNITLFEKEFRSGFLARLTFNQIQSNTYAFYEKVRGRSVLIMHGLLIFDGERKQVVVVGFADLSVIGFTSIWIVVPTLLWLGGFPAQVFGLMAFLFLLFTIWAILYAISSWKFSEVAKFAAQAWKRRYDRNHVSA